jgi:hypothetical protein
MTEKNEEDRRRSRQSRGGFLKGIDIKAFLDVYQEWHTFVEGLCEVLCPWPPRHKAMTAKLRAEIEAEHHYYMLGRAAGVCGWLTICCVIKEVFF